jgi:predicted PurR-regulated permease PerM
VTKIRLVIYLSIFIVLVVAVVFSIFKLNQQNQTITKQNTVPTPTETKIIDWNETTKLIQDCQIKVIFQSRNLQVNLRDKNNQTYQTKEPKFNDIVKLTQEWQGPCDLVQTVTE